MQSWSDPKREKEPFGVIKNRKESEHVRKSGSCAQEVTNLTLDDMESYCIRQNISSWAEREAKKDCK